MLRIGIPVINQSRLTLECLVQLDLTVMDKESFEVVVIDNASDKPFPQHIQEQFGFKVSTIRNDQNIGFYQPILQICKGTTSADLIGLMHNDLFLYEKGWDRRLRDCFINFGELGMVGVCGSSEVDARGGRGGGTK